MPLTLEQYQRAVRVVEEMEAYSRPASSTGCVGQQIGRVLFPRDSPWGALLGAVHRNESGRVYNHCPLGDENCPLWSLAKLNDGLNENFIPIADARSQFLAFVTSERFRAHVMGEDCD